MAKRTICVRLDESLINRFKKYKKDHPDERVYWNDVIVRGITFLCVDQETNFYEVVDFLPLRIKDHILKLSAKIQDLSTQHNELVLKLSSEALPR